MPQTFRIAGAYDVDPSLNRVTGPSGVTRLEPKVMVVLVCLAEHAGHVVSKERLMQAAWPDTAVGDDVLTRAISELRRLFGDDPKQPTVIETIPKSGYRVIATVTPPVVDILPDAAPATAVIVNGRRAWSSRGAYRVAAIAGALVVGLGWTTWWLGQRKGPMPRITPLTVLPGHEQWPTFSPDGNQVAFEWDGEKGENADIYLTMVGSPEIRRLTNDPGPDGAPRWSPDGRVIAYVRGVGSAGRIRLVSPLGGADRMLNDVPVAPPLAWSPDARYLAARRETEPAGIYLVPLDGGAPRLLVASAPPRVESAPAFSPDGRRLAYVSCATGTFGCDVYALELGPTLVPASAPRRLTPSAVLLMGSLTWTPDGRSVVYDALDPLVAYLWRVDAGATRPPERLEAAGLGAAMPATAGAPDRLAFVRIVVDTDVYRFQPGRTSVPVLASSFLDAEARFSRDGRRVAFASMRSGDTFRLWVAGADGDDPQQLTRGPRVEDGSPWWAPDGRRIAFDAIESRDWYSHVWTMGLDGAAPRQLTSEPGDQNVPYWSRDGHWVYHSADRGTGRDVWRVPATGGHPQRVTSGGSGKFACESPDGRSLLYQPSAGDSPLLALPLAGGAAQQLVACVKPSAFGVGPAGVYYVACESRPDPEVHVIDPQTRADKVLGRLEGYEQMFPPHGLAVSPDGASILYPRRIRDSFDLMVMENFR